ncbi:MAG: carboxylating nicotinate-nucleotide diphosphorylase [Pseudomonadota bacterium]
MTPLTDVITNNVRAALLEDLNNQQDVSAQLIPADDTATARVITRQAGIFCGAPWVEETVKQVDASVTVDFNVTDGDRVAPDELLFTLTGAARSLLTAERTMLNFVQLLSGTATKTAHYVGLVAGTRVQLLDTRKTVPGLRAAQKYAVTCGGGENHRLGLFDAYLLKENHLAACGGIANAVAQARSQHPDMPVEVEVESLDELQQAMDAGADIAMVDNFSLQETHQAVEMAKGVLKLEASGGIDETSIKEIAATGVDYISIGELTKNIDPMDLSMRFVS